MKGPFNLSLFISCCALLGMPVHSIAQEFSLENVSISEEAIVLADHPVQFDPVANVSTARLGEGRLFQTRLVLVEIPPGGQIPPSRHLTEEIIYIIAGEGYTTMWVRPGEPLQRYDWTAGDVLSPSLNAWHQHFNTSPDTPVRYVTITSAPLTQNLFYDEEFLTSSNYVFEDRWQKGISMQPQYKEPDTMDFMAGHYIPDLPGRALQERRGSWGITTRPDGGFAGNRIMQLLVREYQINGLLPLDGHRHPWEVVYLVLEGQGSTLLKRGGEPARLVNWKKGELFIVEANEYHDNGARLDSESDSSFSRIMQMRAMGYFFGVGNVGEEDHTPIELLK
jgi:quercetin dioxygenase-like cupin family protein